MHKLDAIRYRSLQGDLGTETVRVSDDVVPEGVEGWDEPGTAGEVGTADKGAAVRPGYEGAGAGEGRGGRPDTRAEGDGVVGGEGVVGEALGSGAVGGEFGSEVGAHCGGGCW